MAPVSSTGHKKKGLLEEQKMLPLTQHALEMSEDIIQNIGTRCSITGK